MASIHVWQAPTTLVGVIGLRPASNGATSIVCASGSPAAGDSARAAALAGVCDHAASMDAAPTSVNCA